MNETADKGVAGGLGRLRDRLRLLGGPAAAGSPGTMGVLSLYQRPEVLMDGFLYSNRTSTSDEKYRGFGSAATLARAEELVRDGGWQTTGQRVSPEGRCQSGWLNQHPFPLPFLSKRGHGFCRRLAYRSYSKGQLGTGQHRRGIRAVGGALDHHLLDDFFQGLAWHRADLLFHHLPLVEEKKRGDAHDVELCGTPTSLIALLRAVSVSWQQHAQTENAREIAETAQELFNRVAKFIEHFEKIRAGLERATGSFNDAVGSYERMVRPSGEKLLKLGGGAAVKDLPAIAPLDATLRLPP